MKILIIATAADANFVGRLRSDLSERGFGVTVARDAVQPGESIAVRIITAIGEADSVIVVLSTASSRSHWVDFETAIAIDASQKAPGKRLIPVLKDADLPTPPMLEHTVYVDLSTPKQYERNLPRLVSTLANPPPPITRNEELRAGASFMRAFRMLHRQRFARHKTALELWHSVAISSAVLGITAILTLTSSILFSGLALPSLLLLLFGLLATNLLSIITGFRSARLIQLREIKRISDERIRTQELCGHTPAGSQTETGRHP